MHMVFFPILLLLLPQRPMTKSGTGFAQSAAMVDSLCWTCSRMVRHTKRLTRNMRVSSFGSGMEVGRGSLRLQALPLPFPMDFLSAGKSMVWDRHTCNNHSISVHRHAKPCGQNEYITSSDNKAMALHIQQLLQHALLYEHNGCLALGSGRQRTQQADHNLLVLLTIYKPDVVHTQASAGHFQSCQTSTSNLA